MHRRQRRDIFTGQIEASFHRVASGMWQHQLVATLGNYYQLYKE